MVKWFINYILPSLDPQIIQLYTPFCLINVLRSVKSYIDEASAGGTKGSFLELWTETLCEERRDNEFSFICATLRWLTCDATGRPAVMGS